MKKTFLAFGLLFLILATMLASLVILNQAVAPLQQLPSYQNIDPGDTFDILTTEVAVETGTLWYGNDFDGIFQVVDALNRIIEIRVTNTNLIVGERLHPGDFLDMDETTTTNFNAVVFAIVFETDDFVVQLYNMDNLIIETQMTPAEYRSIDWNVPVVMVLGTIKVEVSIDQIEFLEDRDTVQVNWIPNDWTLVTGTCIEGLSVSIRASFGELENCLSLPVEYANLDGTLISVCRDGSYFKTYLSLGIIGFDNIEIQNNDIQAGDVFIVGSVWN
jgi:hypothetical protein